MIKGLNVRMPDAFLRDPDKLHVRIHCVSCEAPLWEQRVLKRSGDRVISSETTAIGTNRQRFSHLIENCPLCGKRYYARGHGGVQKYLLTDMNSGIKRLI